MMKFFLFFLERFYFAILTITTSNFRSVTVFIMICILDNVSVSMSKNIIHKPLAKINKTLLNLCCHQYGTLCTVYILVHQKPCQIHDHIAQLLFKVSLFFFVKVST